MMLLMIMMIMLAKVVGRRSTDRWSMELQVHAVMPDRCINTTPIHGTHLG